MNTSSREPWRPELLAGYVDGELGAHDRKTVEAHLAAHPEARAEMNAQKALSRKSELWQQLAIPTLSDAAWNEVAAKIRADLAPQTTPILNYRDADLEKSISPRLNAWRRMAAGISVAAAVVLLAMGYALNKPQANVIDPSGDVLDALVVANDSDVEIISVQGDERMFVVGQPLVEGTLAAIGIGDVVLNKVDSSLDPRGDTKLAEKKPTSLVPNDKTQPVP